MFYRLQELIHCGWKQQTESWLELICFLYVAINIKLYASEGSQSSRFFSFLVKDNKKLLSRLESYSPCSNFEEEKLRSKYVIDRSLDFAISFEELGPATPLLFILSPGVDPLKDVERHGNTLACLIFSYL